MKKMPPHAQFNFDTYIFDLDGTLISSLHDLAASCNYALKLNGMPERTLEEVRMFVGNGVKKLMERAVPGGLENEKFEKTLQDFRKHYMLHNMDNTKPYPDVMEMLNSLTTFVQAATSFFTGVESKVKPSAVERLADLFHSSVSCQMVGESPFQT